MDGTIRAFDLTRYRNFRTFVSPTPVQFSCLAMDPSGEIVCAGTIDDFSIYVFNVQTSQLLEVFPEDKYRVVEELRKLRRGPFGGPHLVGMT